MALVRHAWRQVSGGKSADRRGDLDYFFQDQAEDATISGLGKGEIREGLRRKTTSYRAALCRARVF